MVKCNLIENVTLDNDIKWKWMTSSLTGLSSHPSLTPVTICWSERDHVLWYVILTLFNRAKNRAYNLQAALGSNTLKTEEKKKFNRRLIVVKGCINSHDPGFALLVVHTASFFVYNSHHVWKMIQ